MCYTPMMVVLFRIKCVIVVVVILLTHTHAYINRARQAWVQKDENTSSLEIRNNTINTQIITRLVSSSHSIRN